MVWRGWEWVLKTALFTIVLSHSCGEGFSQEIHWDDVRTREGKRVDLLREGSLAGLLQDSTAGRYYLQVSQPNTFSELGNGVAQIKGIKSLDFGDKVLDIDDWLKYFSSYSGLERMNIHLRDTLYLQITDSSFFSLSDLSVSAAHIGEKRVHLNVENTNNLNELSIECGNGSKIEIHLDDSLHLNKLWIYNVRPERSRVSFTGERGMSVDTVYMSYTFFSEELYEDNKHWLRYLKSAKCVDVRMLDERQVKKRKRPRRRERKWMKHFFGKETKIVYSW